MESEKSTQKKSIATPLRITLVYVVSIVVGAVLAPSLSRVYINLFKPGPNLSLIAFDIDPNNLIDGFLIGYLFSLGFLVALFLKNNKHRFWTWFAGAVLFLLITLGEWKYFGFDLLVSLLGFLLGLCIRKLHEKLVSTKQTPPLT